MNFGRNQLDKPTPARFEFWVKVFVIITGIFCAWMPTNNIIGHHAQDIITPILNLLNSVSLALLPMFGVDVPAKTVPVENVKVMEDKPK